MSLELCNSNCFINLPAFLSEANNWRFREAFPEHAEIVSEYWLRKSVLDLDEELTRDMPVLIQIIKECRNLKQVKYNRHRNTNYFDELPGTIALHCRMLEVLNITGLALSYKGLQELSSLFSLKSLSIDCALIREKEMLNTMFLNNQRLEHVFINIEHGSISFKNLSKSIVKLEIAANSSHRLVDLFENIDKWRLEKLWLYQMQLSKKEVLKISNQTSLKSLKLHTSANISVFDKLFSNNPNLEELEIEPPTYADSLRMLPKTIKHLKPYRSDCNKLIEFAKACQIIHLDISACFGNFGKNLPKLIAVVPSLKSLSLQCFDADDTGLKALKQLKQLNTLRLFDLCIKLDAALTEVMCSCFKLEVLELTNVCYAFGQNLIYSIASLPLLKEIILSDFKYKIDFYCFMKYLSKSKTLTTARFHECKGFNNESAMLLIRGCRTLRDLTIFSPMITADVVYETVKALNEQEDRLKLLHLSIDLEDMLTVVDLHPKLDLIIYGRNAKCKV